VKVGGNIAHVGGIKHRRRFARGRNSGYAAFGTVNKTASHTRLRACAANTLPRFRSTTPLPSLPRATGELLQASFGVPLCYALCYDGRRRLRAMAFTFMCVLG